jgi:hypothetical protein
MKKFSVLFVILFCGIAFSQAENFETGYIDLLKKDIQAESKKLVDENLELTGEQAKLFWPIYDSYDAALLELSNERLNVIADYMLDFYDLSDEKAESLLNRVFEIDQKKLDIQKEYFDKFNAVLPATLVGKFYQIDNYIDLLISLQRSESIPLIQAGTGE